MVSWSFGALYVAGSINWPQCDGCSYQILMPSVSYLEEKGGERREREVRGGKGRWEERRGREVRGGKKR